MKKILPLVIVLVVLAAGGVYYFANKHDDSSNSGTTSNNSSSQTTTTPNESQSSSDAAAQATDKVTIADMAFSPAHITVKKGTTVTWTNQDSVAHTVTETDGQDGPDSQTLGEGQSYTFTFDTAGTFKYDCSIHPSMIGTVTVTE